MYKVKTNNDFNSIIKNNIMKIISFLVVAQPVIDLVVGLSLAHSFYPTIFSLIRLGILIFFLYYFIFINKSCVKQKVTILISMIFIYLVLYFVFHGYNLMELKSSLKVFYFPLLFSIIFSILEETEEKINQKHLLFSLFLYSFIIVVGALTNTAFNSYIESKVGSSGYFYAANEISAIISILLPFAFEYVFSKTSFVKILYLFFIISSIFIIGTKTPFISLIICLLYYMFKFINKKNIIKISMISIISLIILSFLIVKTPIYKNMKIHAAFLKIDNITEIVPRPDLIDHFLLGSRLKLLNENNQIYLNSSFGKQLMGIGYVDNPKLVEMDFCDIFYRQGIIGFILYFSIVIYVISKQIRKCGKKNIMPVVLICLISFTVGHVLIAPAVSIFVAIIMCNFIKECNV